MYIDPLRKVSRAIDTQAHSDHARPGMGNYLCESSGVEMLKLRLGKGISVQGLAYGETIFMNEVAVQVPELEHEILERWIIENTQEKFGPVHRISRRRCLHWIA